MHINTRHTEWQPAPPLHQHTAWLAIQAECADLQCTSAHLKQGTGPSRKFTNLKDVKGYLNVFSIANGGLLVIKCNPCPGFKALLDDHPTV